MLPKNLKKSMRSTRTAFLITLVIIGAIAVYNWFVAPHQNCLLAAQRYQSAADELVRKNQIISNNITIKKEKIKELEDKFKQALSMIFTVAEARTFFSDIQNLSEQANCSVHSLTFSAANLLSGADGSGTNSYITEHQASLAVIGSYGNIIALMSKLQDRPQQVRINSVRIDLNGNNSGELKCSMTITIYVSHMKEKYHNV